MGEAGQVFCGGEETGVSCYAAEDRRILVLDLASNDSLAEGAADGFAGAPHFFGYRPLAGGGARATFLLCPFVCGGWNFGA